MASRGKPRVCWDSNCWISLISGTPGRVDGLRRVAQAAENGDIDLICSFLAMAETAKAHVPGDPNTRERLETIRAAFELDYLTMVVVDRLIAERAQELLRQYRLSGADAVHLATAVLHGAIELHTWDDKLLALDGQLQSNNVTGDPLRINPADWTGQVTLPLA